MIPEEHRARVSALSKAEDMSELAAAINKAKYEQAIKDGNAELAYECKRVNQPKLMAEGKQTSEALWNFLGEIIPELDVEDDCWSLDLDDMVVVPHEHKGSAMGALSRMFGQG